MGRVRKGQACSVINCSSLSVASIALAEASKALGDIKLRSVGAGRVYLCREHFKLVRKKRRKEKIIKKWERLR